MIETLCQSLAPAFRKAFIKTPVEDRQQYRGRNENAEDPGIGRQMPRIIKAADEIVPAASCLGMHHDAQASIEPWMGEIHDLGTLFRDCQIGYGGFDFTF